MRGTFFLYFQLFKKQRGQSQSSVVIRKSQPVRHLSTCGRILAQGLTQKCSKQWKSDVHYKIQNSVSARAPPLSFAKKQKIESAAIQKLECRTTGGLGAIQNGLVAAESFSTLLESNPCRCRHFT